MSFYGPPREKLGQIVSSLKNVETVYDQHNLTTFMHDNLIALMRNETFTTDNAFVAALLANAEDDRDAAKIWRLHTCCWAARSALGIEGDFVECGTYKGFYAGVMMQYLRFETEARQFYLYDTFAGLPAEWSSELEREQANPGYQWDGVYQDVLDRFAIYPNVRITKGVVPEVFDSVVPERIAFLHLDLNAGAAETAALDRLLPRLSDGAMVVLDDFGRLEQADLCRSHLDWWHQHGHMVLELPTGQGLVTYRKNM
jgi:hypothetical protein